MSLPDLARCRHWAMPEDHAPVAVVVGRTWWDVLVDVPALPAEGENLRARRISTHPGGVARPALGAAAAGLATTLWTVTGADEAGRSCVELLTAAGVSVTVATVASSPTSVVLTGGVDRTVLPGPPPPELWARVHVPDQAVLLLGDGYYPAAFVPAAARARARGALVVVDVGATVRPWIADIAAAADVLCGHDPVFRHLAGTYDAAGAADRLVHGTSRVVVRTDGPTGCTVHTADGVFHHLATAVDAVDTTGCGDVFAAALGVALATGAPLADAVATATARAADHAASWGNDWLASQQAVPNAR